MVALYKKEKKKGLTVLNVHYDAKNSHTCLGHRDLYNLGHHVKSNGIQTFSVSLTVFVFKPRVQF